MTQALAGNQVAMPPKVFAGESHHVYTRSDLSDRSFRQGEIVNNIFKVEYKGDDENGSLDVSKRIYELGIIASQDCDLDVANGSVEKIDGILIFKADYFGDLPSNQKNKVHKNNDPRYQYFEAVPPGCDAEAIGLPELIVDFKVFFTLTYEEMLKQLSLNNGMKRRAVLLPPYREHFVNRAAHYIQRVAIDPQHSRV